MMILILVIMLLSLFVGIMIDNNLKLKLKFYQNLKLFLEKTKIDITFHQKPSLNIINETKFTDKTMIKLISNYKEIMYYNFGSDLFKGINILSGEDKAIIENYFLNFGKSDLSNENLKIDSCLYDINRNLNIEIEKVNKLGGLYIKLSLIVGALLCILIV